MARQAVKFLAMGALVAAVFTPAHAITANMADALRHGGYVLVMRHASSPANPPAKSAADPENKGLERQLDEKGRASAEAMGRAFKSLHIPVGAVFVSPTYRARETARLADFPAPQIVEALGDQGQSMTRLKGSGPTQWLTSKVAEEPSAGRNNVIVTQMPNIAAAFPQDASGLQEGGTLVFKPDGQGHARMIAKIPVEDWAALGR